MMSVVTYSSITCCQFNKKVYNDYYNFWWRGYRQGYIPGTDNFTIDRQYAHQRTATDDPVFKWGPWLSKWVQVNAWVGATYDDVTKEIKSLSVK